MSKGYPIAGSPLFCIIVVGLCYRVSMRSPNA